MLVKKFNEGVWFYIIDEEEKINLLIINLYAVPGKIFADRVVVNPLTKEEEFDRKEEALEPLSKKILEASGKMKKKLGDMYLDCWQSEGPPLKCQLFQMSLENEEIIRRNLEKNPKYKKFSTYEIESLTNILKPISSSSVLLTKKHTPLKRFFRKAKNSVKNLRQQKFETKPSH